MPRRGNVPKREVLPDPLYNSVLVTKLTNSIMLDGKKGVAQKVVYGAFDIIKDKTGKEPMEVYTQALENIMPSLEVKARRVGGATYQVPIEVRPRWPSPTRPSPTIAGNPKGDEVCLEKFLWRIPGTSASWPTSTRARRPPPSVFCITPASTTRSARPTRVPPPWTGWLRSRSVVSPSPPPPPPATGRGPRTSSPRPGSTSSTPRATWTSP